MEIYIIHNGQQLGPFPLDHVWAQLDNRDLSAADYALSLEGNDLTSLRDVMFKPVQSLPSDGIWENQKPAGRLQTALRRIGSVVDGQLTAKEFFAGTMLLLIASWIYPPWVLNGHSHGWFLLFDTTHRLAMQIDFGRLVLVDAIIAAVGGFLAWAAFHKWTPFRIAAHLTIYALLIASLVAVVSIVAFLAERHVFNKDPFNALRHTGAISGAGPSSLENEAVLLKAAVTSNAQLEMQPVDESVVGRADLKKINLFDVGVHGYKSSITGLYGRVRNGLARAVQRIAVKASFFTSGDELIEVRTFWMKHRAGVSWEGPVLPNAPISFEEHLMVDHLPEGYTYELEVTEAHYSN